MLGEGLRERGVAKTRGPLSAKASGFLLFSCSSADSMWLALVCPILLLWLHWLLQLLVLSHTEHTHCSAWKAHHITPSLLFVNLSFLQVSTQVATSGKPSVSLKSRLGSLFHALVVMVCGAFTALSPVCPYLNPSGLSSVSRGQGLVIFGLICCICW